MTDSTDVLSPRGHNVVRMYRSNVDTMLTIGVDFVGNLYWPHVSNVSKMASRRAHM